MCVEHVPKEFHLDLLRSIHQSLEPEGRLILTVPNANSSLAARWRYIDWTHETSFTEHSLDFVLSNAGFQKITIQPAEFLFRPRFFYLPISGSRHWWAFCFFRFFRRLEMMAELGPDQGRKIPLSLKLLAIADKY
jgi:SAM-dependent methyltransferase